jgi:magnesium transporter
MPVEEDTLRQLAVEFELHPLLVEDALHEQPRPKFDSFPDGSFISWLYVLPSVDSQLLTGEIDAFIGSDYLITVHGAEVPQVLDVFQELSRQPTLGTDWLLHAIVDRLVDSLLPYVDELGDALDDIEDRLLDRPTTDDLQKLYTIRRRLVSLHRIISPERDLIRGLARERNIVSEDAYRYFQDVGDHLAHVEDSIETYRDVGAAAMDIYLSAQNNRMNEIMKQLTVVATIFMPLTLISGIYGMNLLRGMWPVPTGYWSFVLVIGSMISIATAMSLYFRRKQWW